MRNRAGARTEFSATGLRDWQPPSRLAAQPSLPLKLIKILPTPQSNPPLWLAFFLPRNGVCTCSAVSSYVQGGAGADTARCRWALAARSGRRRWMFN